MEISYNFEVWFGCVLTIAILGAFGNLFTIIAVVYATIKTNHGFGTKKWLEHTVFIFNLMFVDCCACMLVLATLIYAAIVYAREEKILALTVNKHGDSICQFLILGVQNLAQITGWSVALILSWRAFERYR